MGRNISIFTLLLGISVTLVHGGLRAADGNVDLGAISNQIFSRNFIAEVGLEDTGNVICSPLSAQLALGMTRLGARGNTKNQLTEKLGLAGQTEEQNKQAFIELRDQLLSENVNGTVLRIANKMFAANSLNVKIEFEKKARNVFGVKPSSVDFEDPNTRLNINQWVQNVTQDKIKNLIQEGTLGENTKLILVNALYFKGLWKTPFNPAHSSERNFYLDNQPEVKIPFMYHEGSYKMKRSYTDLNASVLELPYMGDGLSFVIVMPSPVEEAPARGPFTFNRLRWNDETGRVTPAMSLSELESAMRTRELGDLLRQTRNYNDLQVHLPKFTMELTLDLQGPLQKMGINDIFGGAADLSGISNVSKLFVSKVVQKSFIEITEEGTEAAAATSSEFTLLSAPPPPTRFEVNRPFLFYLIQRTNSNIPVVLFSGRYVTPPQSKTGEVVLNNY